MKRLKDSFESFDNPTPGYPLKFLNLVLQVLKVKLCDLQQIYFLNKRENQSKISFKRMVS